MREQPSAQLSVRVPHGSAREAIFLHFPRDGHRKCVDESNIAGNLVVGYLALTEVLKGFFRCMMAISQSNARANDFAIFLVWNSNHGNIEHRRMSVEEFLISRGEIFSPPRIIISFTRPTILQ